MFIRGRYKSNGTVKMAMIIPQKETQEIGLSPFKGFKSTRIGWMTLQGREEVLLTILLLYQSLPNSTPG